MVYRCDPGGASRAVRRACSVSCCVAHECAYAASLARARSGSEQSLYTHLDAFVETEAEEAGDAGAGPASWIDEEAAADTSLQARRLALPRCVKHGAVLTRLAPA